MRTGPTALCATVGWLSLTASAAPFDHGHTALDALLATSAGSAGVDYGAVAAQGRSLDAYLASLAEAPVATFDADQQLAFWIDAYNAVTLDLIVDNQPLASIRDLDGGQPWTTRRYRVGGQTLTLDDIEHRRVRPLGDARIHAALNCASRGCPPLSSDAFTAVGLDAQLDRAARAWVATNAYAVEGGVVRPSAVFGWYEADFRAWNVARGGADDPSAATLAFLRAFGATLPAGATVGPPLPYDWRLNAR
jgi:hypothetical protein